MRMTGFSIVIALALGCLGFPSWLSVYAFGDTDASFATTGRPYTSNAHAWAYLPWTGDDRALAAARALVDQDARRAGFWSRLKRYSELAQTQPTNSAVVFKWVYADWIAGFFADDEGKLMNDAPSNANMLACSDLSDTYDGARIRFLWECEHSNSPELCSLGERLLKRNSKDPAVDVELAWIYRNTMKQGDQGPKDRAVKLCRAALSELPNSGIAYGVLSDIYFDAVYSCDGFKDDGRSLSPIAQADLTSAIAALRREASPSRYPGDKAWHEGIKSLLIKWESILQTHGSHGV